MDLLMKKLDVLTNTWKRLPEHGTKPEIPLLWTVKAGDLYLDDLRICEVGRIDESRLDEYVCAVEKDYFEVPLKDELLVVFVVQILDSYDIFVIESIAEEE